MKTYENHEGESLLVAERTGGISIIAENDAEIGVDYSEPVSSFKDLFVEFAIKDDDFPPSGLIHSHFAVKPRLAKLNEDAATPKVSSLIHKERHNIGDIHDVLSFLRAVRPINWPDLRKEPRESVIIVALGSPVKRPVPPVDPDAKPGELLFYPVVYVTLSDKGTEEMRVKLVLDGGNIQWLAGNYFITLEPATPVASKRGPSRK